MTTSIPRKIGDTWYTDDAEYGVIGTASGWAVRRGDSSYAEFLDSADAYEAAELLAKGERDDADYLWRD